MICSSSSASSLLFCLFTSSEIWAALLSLGGVVYRMRQRTQRWQKREREIQSLWPTWVLPSFSQMKYLLAVRHCSILAKHLDIPKYRYMPIYNIWANVSTHFKTKIMKTYRTFMSCMLSSLQKVYLKACTSTYIWFSDKLKHRDRDRKRANIIRDSH